MDKKGHARAKSQTKKTPQDLANDERLRQEENAAEEAQRRKKQDTPMDVMSQKGYYDALISAMEEKRSNIQQMDEEIAEEQNEKDQLEAQIAQMQQHLEQMEPSIATKKEQLKEVTLKLRELQASPGAPPPAPEAFGASPTNGGKPGDAVPVDPAMVERANQMRAEYRNSVLQNAAPLEFGLSATPRVGGGVEAVETCSLEAVGASGLRVPVRCYSLPGRPFNAAPAPPAIVFFHGGGYVQGDLDTHDWLCRSLTALAGSTVVSVDYRRAPEHKYPAAIDDAYTALLWVARGGLGGYPRQLAVAGDCAGGGLAAACCLRAKADPDGPKIAVQLLAYPWLDLRPNSSSMTHAFADGRHGLSNQECQSYREMYAPPLGPGGEYSAPGGRGAWTEELDASPFLAQSLVGLPRAFIVYPVNSMLADESVAFVERFRREVGPEAVHTMRVEGQQHHFAVMANNQQTQQVVFAAATFLSAMLWA